MEFILKYKKLFASLFWIWVMAILYFTFTPSSPNLKFQVNENSIRLDYLLHFLVYLCLTILYLLWQLNKQLNFPKRSIIYFTVVALFFSILSEYLQNYIPGRTFNPVDFYFNASGIILGVLLPKLFFKLNPNSGNSRIT